jgi:hypothetical protein
MKESHTEKVTSGAGIPPTSEPSYWKADPNIHPNTNSQTVAAKRVLSRVENQNFVKKCTDAVDD